MTTPTAVARAVARTAERRARAALDDVLAAHTALSDAETAVAAASAAKAAAGPVLARAIAAARDAGISDEDLTELGISPPSARTLRRRAAPAQSTKPVDAIAEGHPEPAVLAAAADLDLSDPRPAA